MLRTGQSLLANSLVALHLGRGTFFSSSSHYPSSFSVPITHPLPITGMRKREITDALNRVETPTRPPSNSRLRALRRDLNMVPRRAQSAVPFLVRPPLHFFTQNGVGWLMWGCRVHRMALAGKELGKDVGQWFGPSTAAGALRCVFFSPPLLVCVLMGWIGR